MTLSILSPLVDTALKYSLIICWNSRCSEVSTGKIWYIELIRSWWRIVFHLNKRGKRYYSHNFDNFFPRRLNLFRVFAWGTGNSCLGFGHYQSPNEHRKWIVYTFSTVPVLDGLLNKFLGVSKIIEIYWRLLKLVRGSLFLLFWLPNHQRESSD